MNLTSPEMARRKAMMCALEARARDANKFLDTVEVPIFSDGTGWVFYYCQPGNFLEEQYHGTKALVGSLFFLCQY